MTLDEAMNAAVLGSRVRAVNMLEGTFIDYNFNGWRIHHAAGASSGFHFTEHDNVEWEEVSDEHYDAYKRVVADFESVRTREQATIAAGGWGKTASLQAMGRALRSVPPAPVVSKAWALDAGKEVLSVPAPVAAPAPIDAPNVGKWGKPAIKDKWGR